MKGIESGLLARLPGFPLFLISVLVVLAAIAHFILSPDALLFVTVEAGLVIGLGLTLTYGGYRVTRSDVAPRNALRIFAVTLLLGLVGFCIAALVVALHAVQDDPIGDPAYVLLLSTTGASAVGVPVGFYYISLQESHNKLQREYAATRTLSKQLSITQRVLRHNLRNELTIIAGIAEDLDAETDDATLEARLATLQAHADALHHLSEEAAHLARIWNTDERTQIDVAAEVETAAAELARAYPDVEIEVSTPDSAPVVAHPALPDAIEELFANAVEHNDTAALQISATVSPEAGPSDHTRVEIADTGTGIPETEIKPLEQPQEEQLSHGQGLGLWVIYWTIQRSGGEIAFNENTPSGTVVTLDLQHPHGETEHGEPAGVEDAADEFPLPFL